MTTLAVFRGLLAGAVSLVGLWLIQGRFPSFTALRTGPGTIVALTQGAGLVAFCAAVQGTSAANALLMTATAPFLAAVLSWALLRERIADSTWAAIGLAFAVVFVVALGGLGGGRLIGDLLALPLADFTPMSSQQVLWLFVSGAVILPLAVALLSPGPRYLTAPEVSMMTLMEIILGPLLVWAVLGEEPERASLVGGAMIVLAVPGHAMWRMRCPQMGVA